MSSCFGKLLSYVRAISAFWLIFDIFLDGVQVKKYHHFSPYLNIEHEANLDLKERMLDFCLILEKSDFNQTLLEKEQNKLHAEWTYRCKQSDFNFTMPYGLYMNQTVVAKVCQKLNLYLIKKMI